MKKQLAALLGVALVGAGVTFPATAEAATAPAEVKTIPGDPYPLFTEDRPVFAGATGFLHQRLSGTTSWMWTRYSDRHTVVVDELARKGASTFVPTGGDTLLVNAGTPWWTFDLSTMTRHDLPVTGTPIAVRVFGESLLVIRVKDGVYVPELSQLTADGSTAPTPISGVPEGTVQINPMAGDAATAVLRFVSPAGIRFGLLDVVTGRVTLLPEAGNAARVVLSADRVGLLNTTEVRTFSRAGIASGTNTTPTNFTLTAATAVEQLGLAGTDLIVAPPTSSFSKTIMRYRPDGTRPTQVTLYAFQYLAQAPDGVLFLGGSDHADWSVRKATETGESVVLPQNVQINAGVTLSSGVLRHLQALVQPGETPAYSHFGFELAPDAAGLSPTVGAGIVRDPEPCEDDAVCVRAVDGYRGGTSYLRTLDSTLKLMTTTTGDGGGLQTVPSTGGTVVDASPNYRIVNGSGPDQQYIYKTSDNTPPTVRAVTGAGLWLDTLWSAAGAGHLTSEDLAVGTVGADIATGVNCAATEVQATAAHVYWSCGRTGPSGVRDLARKVNLSLPGGQYLLGDNYVVRHDPSGILSRYDLTGGTLGTPVTLATFPRGELADDRNVSWAVDKFGGDVAWVDSANTTHIVDPGVAPSPLTTFPDHPAGNFDLPGTVPVTLPLTRPVGSTSFTVKQVRTGTVTTFPGGSSRTVAAGSWDGMIAGKRALRGAYEWSLSATVDGVPTRLTSGTLNVHCGGTPTLHSYDCGGRPNLFGLTSTTTGAGQWQSANAAGTAFANSGSAEALSAVTAVVPFGDVSKDFKNDLLVRRSDGTMRAYRGDDAPPFTGNTITAVPGNWNRWDALIHTGDLTGDGQSDLIARDRTTGTLYRINGDGKGGFGTPVAYPSAYKSFSRFVGPGDLNGDGKADLLLLIGTEMYVKYGDGKGNLGDRQPVSTGWLGYNAIVGAGDLNEDGKGDLVVRDAAGNLYRRLSTGTGTFGDRLLIGTGYQKYASIY